MTIKIDFTKFKPQFTADKIARLVATPGGIFAFPIESLSPARTVGRGKQTYITVQSTSSLDFEAGVGPFPYARVGGPGLVSMHFCPADYGITSAGDYIMEFNVQSGDSGKTTSFKFSASPGVTTHWDPYTVDSDGGWGQLIMKSVPSQGVYGTLTYDGGDAWNWFFTSVQRA
jgi:hypothetical protein